MNPLDGLLVIGGYDKSRIAGQFTNFSMDDWSVQQSCPLKVKIKTILYTERGSSSNTLFSANVSAESDDDKYLPACLEPFQERFTFPQAVAASFGNATGWSRAYGKFTYPLNRRPSGDLTIILDNDYSTTIPNSALFTPKRGSDPYGHYVVTNSSIIETGVTYNLEDDPGDIQPLLGGMWLTQNYLLVDYAHKQFQLARAAQATVTPIDIVPICSTESESANTHDEKADKTNKSGDIAGSVVGSVIGSAIICGIVFLMFRKHRRWNVHQQALDHSAQTTGIMQDPYQDFSSPTELPLVCVFLSAK